MWSQCKAKRLRSSSRIEYAGRPLTQEEASMRSFVLAAALKAANASPKDVVHVFIFRTRPRMGDIGKASAIVNSYFAPYNHKPATTNMAVLELAVDERQ